MAPAFVYAMQAQLRLIKTDSTRADVLLTVRGITIEGITVEQESWGPLRLNMPDPMSLPSAVRGEVTSPGFIRQLLVAVVVRWPTAELSI